MRLLITGGWDASQQELASLRALGHEIAWHQWEREPLPVSCDWPEGIICNGLFLHHPIEKFTSLTYIQATSAGLDRIPVDYAREHGIAVFHAKDVYSVPMAEYVLWGVLQMYRQGRFFQRNQEDARWKKLPVLPELAGKTVCIVGCGDVGSACAKRFRAMDCRILGVNRTHRELPCLDEQYPLEDLDTALPQADVVILTIALTVQTRRLFDSSRFGKMKPGSILVNVARGGIVDTEALLEALENRLGGAVLDVFEEEPLPEASPLWKHPNVILTPHNSYAGEGNKARLYRVILNNLEKYG